MTLTNLCKALGWPRLRRWKHVIDRVRDLAPPPPIEWPKFWIDHGSKRRFDDVRNYPAAGPGIVYARQIAELLDYPLERVLKYHMLRGTDDTKLPDWWQYDRYGSYYCTEEQAVEIVERIRESRR